MQEGHSLKILGTTLNIFVSNGRTFLCSSTLLTFGDIVQNNVASVAENAALQSRTVQMEAVHVVWRGIVVKYGQITGN